MLDNYFINARLLSAQQLIQPVILCGGSGTRLWPLSRTGFPKQFLCLTGDESLFQQAVRRLKPLQSPSFNVSEPYVICNEEHRFLASEQLRELGIKPGALLLEPQGRNTAPALTIAALAALQQGADPILVVTPADQNIADEAAFGEAVNKAVHEAIRGSLVILGIKPDRPDTGYGYIKAVQKQSAPTFIVERFVEKPNQETADSYLKQGGFFWNAGIFVLKASVWLKALGLFRPDIAEAAQLAWAKRTRDANFIRPDKALFSVIPSESIDYAVIEHCPGTFPISMVPLDACWCDLGAWDAVWDVSTKDVNGNAYHGDVLSVESSNNLVRTTGRLVGMVGVSNLVVVETADAVLVADKSHSQDVKQMVSQLTRTNREECKLHRKVHRPWGWYDSIDQGDRFKVKRIQVNPGASLSLQKHQYRAEHWIVVKGMAEITCGDRMILLKENQSTYIPLGENHRLANPTLEPLEIIEVQSGSYLGEDDIIRIEDHYGRGQL